MSALEGARALSAGDAARALGRFLRSRQSVSGALHGPAAGAAAAASSPSSSAAPGSGRVRAAGAAASGPPLPDETLSQLEIVYAELAHQAAAPR
jgi:hypothetical protein